MKKYTIGEVAKITSVPTKTLRFYEEENLIKCAGREENGYRYFTEENVDEILLIKNARDLGFPLMEIKKLTTGCKDRDCEHTKEQNKRVIDNYISILTMRIEEMEKIRKRMVNLQKNGPYCCEFLHQLVINNRKEGDGQMEYCKKCGKKCKCGDKCRCDN